MQKDKNKNKNKNKYKNRDKSNKYFDSSKEVGRWSKIDLDKID